MSLASRENSAYTEGAVLLARALEQSLLQDLYSLRHPDRYHISTSRTPSVQAGYLMQLVAMDLVELFPESKYRSKYIVVVSDYFTINYG